MEESRDNRHQNRISSFILRGIYTGLGAYSMALGGEQIGVYIQDVESVPYWLGPMAIGAGSTIMYYGLRNRRDDEYQVSDIDELESD